MWTRTNRNKDNLRKGISEDKVWAKVTSGKVKTLTTITNLEFDSTAGKSGK